MKITRDVVVDLLPVYAAGEASADTSALVENFLQHDSSLTALLQALRETDAATVQPESDPPEALERDAINRTRVIIRRRSWTLALGVFFTLLPLTFAFDGGRVTFFMLRDEPGSALFWVSAVYLWWHYGRLTRRLRTAIPHA